jgi:hypothetical protein
VQRATDRPLPLLVAVAGTVVLVALALPMPRGVGDVEAAVTVTPTATKGTSPLADPYDQAFVEVQLTPPDAAEEARWFQVSAWQGGGLRLADLEKVGEGRYRSEAPVPVGGAWKTIIRLHRGGELMTVPVFLPADPALGEPEISAINRTQPFEAETRYLLRETRDNSRLLANVVYALLAVVGMAWIAAFAIAAGRLVPQTRRPDRSAVPVAR